MHSISIRCAADVLCHAAQRNRTQDFPIIDLFDPDPGTGRMFGGQLDWIIKVEDAAVELRATTRETLTRDMSSKESEHNDQRAETRGEMSLSQSLQGPDGSSQCTRYVHV